MDREVSACLCTSPLECRGEQVALSRDKKIIAVLIAFFRGAHVGEIVLLQEYGLVARR